MEPDWIIVAALVASPLAVLAMFETATRWRVRRRAAVARRSKSSLRGKLSDARR